MVRDIQDVPRVQPCRKASTRISDKPSQVRNNTVLMHASHTFSVLMFNCPAMHFVSLLSIYRDETAT